MANELVVGAVGLLSLFVLRVLWRIWKSPNRKYVVSIGDAVCDVPAMLNIGSFGRPAGIVAAIASAIKKTKLSDFGGGKNSQFLQLYQTTRDVGLKKSKAKFSPAGGALCQVAMEERVSARLKFIDYLKKHPTIDKLEIKPPIFVIGLTRTGTTFLHELLSNCEHFRSHYTWEQMNPVPTTDDENIDAQTADRVKRFDIGKPKFNLLFDHLIHNKIQHIHRIEYEETEECTIPCSFELPWALIELPLMIFAIDEILPFGVGDAYELYKRVLKLLTWQSKDRRNQDFTWMLKCPFHLPYLPELFETFPNSTIVWTHRDPAECVASACSLFETIMQMGMEDSSVDPMLIGKAVMRYTHICLDRAQAALDNLPAGINVVHVRYSDTLKAPKKTCETVLAAVSISSNSCYVSSYLFYLHAKL